MVTKGDSSREVTTSCLDTPTSTFSILTTPTSVWSLVSHQAEVPWNHSSLQSLKVARTAHSWTPHKQPASLSAVSPWTYILDIQLSWAHRWPQLTSNCNEIPSENHPAEPRQSNKLWAKIINCSSKFWDGFQYNSRVGSIRASLVAQLVQNPAAIPGDLGLISGLGRSPGGGHGNPLQYSYQENPHLQKSLVGYSLRGCRESDMTEWLSTAQVQHT